MSLRQRVSEYLRHLGRNVEDAICEIVETLKSPDLIRMFSEVYPPEDDGLALMECIAKRYNLPFLMDYVQAKTQYRVSFYRKGREEMTGVLKRAFGQVEEEKRPKFSLPFLKRGERRGEKE